MHVAQRPRGMPPPLPLELSEETQEALRGAYEFSQQVRADHEAAGLEQLASFTGLGFDALAVALEQHGGLAAATAVICKYLRGIASGGGRGSGGGPLTEGAEGADALALQGLQGDVSTDSRQRDSDFGLVRVTRAAHSKRPGISACGLRRAATPSLTPSF